MDIGVAPRLQGVSTFLQAPIVCLQKDLDLSNLCVIYHTTIL